MDFDTFSVLHKIYKCNIVFIWENTMNAIFNNNFPVTALSENKTTAIKLISMSHYGILSEK